MIKEIEEKLHFKFPKDFIDIIKQYDGGYPIPNKVKVERILPVKKQIYDLKLAF